MASTFSNNLKLQLMGTGDNAGTWGNTTNLNLGTALEEAITGTVDVNVTSANVTLTASNTSASQTFRNLRVNVIGSPAVTRSITIPSGIAKLYLVNNETESTVQIRHATGSNVSVPAGKTMFVYCTGSNVVDAVTHLSNLTLSTPLAVAHGGTGSNSGTFSGANITALNASNITTGTLANGRTTGSSVNSASTLVLRDANGDFASRDGTFRAVHTTQLVTAPEVTVNGPLTCNNLTATNGSFTALDSSNAAFTTLNVTTLNVTTLNVSTTITGNVTATQAEMQAGTQGANRLMSPSLVKDAILALSSPVPVGSVITTASATPPTGYLRCDGSQVSTTTYSNLFSTVSTRFSPLRNIYTGSRPFQLQPNNEQLNGQLIAGGVPWTDAGANLDVARKSATAFVTKNRVYVVGGVSAAGANLISTSTASINSDGTLGSFSAGPSLPAGAVVNSATSHITKDRVYILGGSPANAYTAPINADGTIGTWSVVSPALNIGRTYAPAFVCRNRFYTVSGYTGTAGSNVAYVSTISSDGLIAPVVNFNAGAYPLSTWGGNAFVLGDFAYLFTGVFNATIYCSYINRDGSLRGWQLHSTAPVSNYYSDPVVATKNRVFLFPGTGANSTVTTSVYYANVNIDGTLSTNWQLAHNLPSTRTHLCMAISNSKVFIFGGAATNGGTALGTVIMADFNGGSNDYISDHPTYISAEPDSGNFYLPNISPKPTYYGFDYNLDPTYSLFSNLGVFNEADSPVPSLMYHHIKH